VGGYLWPFISAEEDAFMPHTITSESNGRGVVITLSGVVKGDEIHGLNEQLVSDALFLQRRYEIWDFSNVDKLELSLDQLRGFAIQDSIAARKNPNQRIAIVRRMRTHSGLDPDRTFHVLERTWGGYESRTFLDVDSARQWAESGGK
jgi:hypothetical protein